MKIGVLDYGAGNLHSVSNALNLLGMDVVLVDKAVPCSEIDSLIIPGVGAFKPAMDRIRERHLDTFVHEFHKSGKTIIGICLGMQLLATSSSEHSLSSGLNLISGEINKIDGVNKLPSIGWYRVEVKGTPFNDRAVEIINNNYFYFVHSYHFRPTNNDKLLGTYQIDCAPVSAIVGSENVIGFQFHPEKSGEAGLALLYECLT